MLKPKNYARVRNNQEKQTFYNVSVKCVFEEFGVIFHVVEKFGVCLIFS